MLVVKSVMHYVLVKSVMHCVLKFVVLGLQSYDKISCILVLLILLLTVSLSADSVELDGVDITGYTIFNESKVIVSSTWSHLRRSLMLSLFK